MNRQTDAWPAWGTRKTDRQMEQHINKQMDEQIDRLTDIQPHG